MDPVTVIGLTASVTQLAHQTFKIFGNLSSYYRDVRKAPKRSKELRDEIDLLTHILVIIRDSQFDSIAAQHWPMFQETFRMLEALLQDLYRLTEPKETSGIGQLKWPFSQAENAAQINKIERLKSNLNLLLKCRRQDPYSSLLILKFKTTGAFRKCSSNQ